MPIKKGDAFERHPVISLRPWKGGQMKRIKFMDEGKDVTVQHGLSYLYLVREVDGDGNEGDLRELWIAPNSPLCIGLAPHVPLTGKTFEITKTTGKTRSETRYEAVIV